MFRQTPLVYRCVLSGFGIHLQWWLPEYSVYTMESGHPSESAMSQAPPSVRCGACHDAIESPSRHSVSYLLVEQLTIPVLGCSDHLEEFRSICGLTTDAAAELLTHQPAGGIQCPRCRLTARSRQHALIPVAGGLAVILSCPEHQSDIAARFQTGLRTRRQLQSTVTTSTDT